MQVEINLQSEVAGLPIINQGVQASSTFSLGTAQIQTHCLRVRTKGLISGKEIGKI